MNDTALLLELAQRLEASGSTVVRFKDHLQIRLAVFASVQVRIVDGRLSCEPRFGVIPRDRVAWATILGLGMLSLLAFIDLGITPLSMALGFLATSSGTSTAIRYQLTEGCITRVQTAYMLMTAGAPVQPFQLGAAEPPPSSFKPRQGARIEREDA